MYRRILAGFLAVMIMCGSCINDAYAAGAAENKTTIIEAGNIETEVQVTTVPETECKETESKSETEIENKETESKNETITEIEDKEIETESKLESITETETDESKSKPESITETETETNETESICETITENDIELETELTDIETELETKTETIFAEIDPEEIFVEEEGDPAYVFQAGGFKVLDTEAPKIQMFSAESAVDMDAVAAAIYKGLQNKAVKVDLKNFELAYNDTNRKLLLNAYYAVVNDHPELYYVRTAYGISYIKNGNITAITPKYYTDMDDAAFHAAVEKAKTVVTEDMDDMQKAIAIHEYLVLTCEYDKERLASGSANVPKESYNAYGVLVGNIAVCQGYALAFKYLMNEYGIACYIVTSDTSNHAWNMVQLNGKYYQLDATWDDPTWDKYGRVSHKYLFVSDEKLAEAGGHLDWYVTKGSGIVDDIHATDTIYDTYFWSDVTSPLVYEEGSGAYYFVDSAQNIAKKNYVKSSYTFDSESETVREKIGTAYAGLALSGKNLYFNTPTAIMRLELQNSDVETRETVRFRLPEDSSDKIYGFTRFDNVIRYVKQNAASQRVPVYALDDSKEDTPAAEIVNGKKYIVTFKDEYDTIFAKIEVEEGGYAVPPKSFTPQPGYKFSQWKGNYSNIRKDETVLAVYTAITYKISYELNGGKNIVTNTANPTKYTVEEDDIILKEPENSNKDIKFLGWYKDRAYTQPITTIPKGSYGNLTLYAKWEPLVFTVTFLDSTDEILSQVKVEEGEDAAPPSDAAVPEGYIRSWEGNYKNVQQDETVKVVYTPIVYPISYELGGGENNAANPVQYTIETDDFSLEMPVPPSGSLVFAGWYSDSECTQPVASITKGSYGDLIFYAKWETKVFTVTFVDSTGELLSKEEVEVGKDAAPPIDAAVPIGYIRSWEGSYKNVQQNETVKAVYTPIVYHISYELEGGENNAANPTDYTIETDDFSLETPIPPSDDLVFGGWYRDREYTQPVTTIAKGSSGDLLLYAKWETKPPLMYTVTFVDSTGEPICKEEVEEGKDVLPPADIAVPKGYVYRWEGNYENVQQDEIVKVVYTPEIYAISYELNGGENNAINPTSYTIETDDFSLEPPANPASYMVFGGWYQDSSFTQPAGTVAKGGTGNLTFYAKWEDTRGFWVDVQEEYAYTGKAVSIPDVGVYYKADRLTAGVDYTIAYKNNVNAASALDKDAPAIVVTAKGNYGGQIIKKFSIVPVSMDSDTISVQEMAVAYRKGKTQKPVPTVTWNGVKLTNGKDYTVDYAETPEFPGKYTVIVKGKGNFTGSTQTVLTIADNKETVAMGSVKIVKKIPKQEYTAGGVHIRADMVTLKYGSTVLSPGKDYELEQTTFTESGTNYVTIKGKGTYVGELTTSFKIKGTAVSTLKLANLAFTGQERRPVLTDKNGVILREGIDYVVNSLTGTEAVGTAKASITGKGAYYGTANKSFKITACPVTSADFTMHLAVAANTQPYEKGGAKPKVVAVYGGRTLVEGTDYTLSYKNNKSIGALATVTVKGKKNFKGSRQLTFTVGKSSLSRVAVYAPDKIVSGKVGGYVSTPVLTDTNGVKLKAGRDYEKNIVYKDKKGVILDKKSDKLAAGSEVTVEITGKGNYEGKVSTTYRILLSGKDLAKAKVKVNAKKYYDNGNSVTLSKSDLTVKIGKVTVPSDAYELVEGSYINNDKKGTAKVTIRGIGQYGGTKTVSYKIYAQKWNE